jgi:hypothetical protein
MSAGTPLELSITGFWRRLLDQLPQLTDELTSRVLAGEDEFTDMSPASREYLRRLCEKSLRVCLESLVAGEGRPELTPIRRSAHKRALLGVPLRAMLHSYQIGAQYLWGKLQAFAERQDAELRAALLAQGHQLWSGLELVTTALQESYQEAVRDQVGDGRVHRDRLFEAVLLGRPSDAGTVADCAAALDLPRFGRFRVLVMSPDRPSGIEGGLRDRGVHSVWRAASGERIAILSFREGTSFATIRHLLDDAGRIGVSPTFDHIVEASAHLRLARLAAASLEPGATGVVRYGERLLPTLLASTPHTGGALADQVLAPLRRMPRGDAGELLDTAWAWFESEGSTARTAELLFCHRNTVRNRLRRLEQLTGRRFEVPHEMAELLVAVQAHRLGLRRERESPGQTRPPEELVS